MCHLPVMADGAGNIDIARCRHSRCVEITVATRTNKAQMIRFPLWSWIHNLDGEFDPGSGQTLAACLTHASRTGHSFRTMSSGGRVSNTWATCHLEGDTPRQRGVRPHKLD